MAGSSPSVDPAAVNSAAHRRYAVRQVIARAQWGFAVVLVLVWVLGITEHAALVVLAIAAAGSALAVWQGVEQPATAACRRRLTASLTGQCLGIAAGAGMKSSISGTSDPAST